MPSEVRHLVDRGGAYPLVRLTGVLDSRTAPTVRSALFDLLAEQPEALVVDVAELPQPSADAIAVLREIRQTNAAWPEAHLALCGGAAEDGDGAGRTTSWQSSGWSVWSDPQAAFAALGAPDHEHRVGLEMEPVLGAARRSRELITEACGRWERPELAGPACIVATELVNNVVVHARTPMAVLLAVHGDGMSVAVRDQSPVEPVFSGGPVPVTAYGGRGMLLIDSVAQRWGCLPLTGGKVVWALLAGEEREPEPLRNPSGASMADPARG